MRNGSGYVKISNIAILFRHAARRALKFILYPKTRVIIHHADDLHRRNRVHVYYKIYAGCRAKVEGGLEAVHKGVEVFCL